MSSFVTMSAFQIMTNFDEKRDLCEQFFTQIPLFPGLSVTDISAFILVTRSGCMIALKHTPVKSNTIIFAKNKFAWGDLNSITFIFTGTPFSFGRLGTVIVFSNTSLWSSNTMTTDFADDAQSRTMHLWTCQTTWLYVKKKWALIRGTKVEQLLSILLCWLSVNLSIWYHWIQYLSFCLSLRTNLFWKRPKSFSVGLPRMACVFVCGINILDRISCHFNSVTPSKQNSNAILTRLSVNNYHLGTNEMPLQTER